MIITGFAGGETTSRGRVRAFSARTGKSLWTFFTVPGPGELGHDSWPADNPSWQYGGATVWQTPAVDPKHGLVYFSTGNAAPDFNGSLRKGDNLFSVSMVAIEANTGKYRWHFQQVHHDLWDYDSPSPVVLFDLMYHGQPREAIAEIGKTGWVYILDRVTGKPLIGIDELPVPQEPRQNTSATQPFPVGDPVVPHEIDIPPAGFRLLNEGRIFTPYWEKAVVAKPSPWGGTNWPPSSYDPRQGFLFVCANDQMGRFMVGHHRNRSRVRLTRRVCSASPTSRGLEYLRQSTCAATRSSGVSAGRTAATAAPPPPAATSSLPAATTAASWPSIRATAMCCGNFRPAPA
jgi:alcohol dehydrogenase (cytochrome c)